MTQLDTCLNSTVFFHLLFILCYGLLFVCYPQCNMRGKRLPGKIVEQRRNKTRCGKTLSMQTKKDSNARRFLHGKVCTKKNLLWLWLDLLTRNSKDQKVRIFPHLDCSLMIKLVTHGLAYTSQQQLRIEKRLL